eukprot:CAMPEP_0180779846 /NCGR_PEP_ID=MMETSP1038_2-20121128/46658_1 /TAXON_ID=632150 /ORGANISM="Azadinium spinosum, Strain 3D9" /LENGTH=314 /DNA_ID=CAMNT_0022815275 /DNA_START=24 /DNA_END=964 /DNA_ORIENTATION=+
MGNAPTQGAGGQPSGLMCGCSPESCVNEHRSDHFIVNSSVVVDPARGASHFQYATGTKGRAIVPSRSLEDVETVTLREDGGVCLGDMDSVAGTIRYQNGDVYTGEWRNRRAVGYGRVVRPDTSTYEGQWSKDSAHGEGTETFPDGSWYRGSYHYGAKSGFGVFNWENGPHFCGQFEDNVFSGEGTYYWGDGRRYNGQWARNEFHGHGRMAWPNGEIYDGQYAFGQKDGEGTFIWASGRRFTGRWKDGQQHGIGISYVGKGQQRTGIWEAGRRLRWLREDELQLEKKMLAVEDMAPAPVAAAAEDVVEIEPSPLP